MICNDYGRKIQVEVTRTFKSGYRLGVGEDPGFGGWCVFSPDDDGKWHKHTAHGANRQDAVDWIDAIRDTEASR